MERGSNKSMTRLGFVLNELKSNLESDYLLVQFIYVSGWAKGVANIETGQRVGHRVSTNGVGAKG